MATREQSQLDKLINKYVKKRLPNMRKKLRDSARSRHRYQNQTGDLTRSVGTKYNASRLSLKPIAKMSYAKYVINGHGTWAGDNFLSNASRRERKYLRAQFEAAIDAAVNEFNNSKRGTSGASVHNGI